MFLKLIVYALSIYCLFSHGFCCPSGWVTHGPNCYHFSHDTEPWIGALQFCRELKGQLVEINDVTESNFLKSQIKLRKQTFWIGLSDVEEEGTWVWMSSRTQLTADDFADWVPGQPDNYKDNENCACVYKDANYLWNDYACQNSVHYICEKADGSAEIVG